MRGSPRTLVCLALLLGCSADGERARPAAPPAPAPAEAPAEVVPGPTLAPAPVDAGPEAVAQPELAATAVGTDAGPASSADPAGAGSKSVRLPVAQSSDAELRLLVRARRLLRKAPAKALAITVDHQRAFKEPHQAERRELIAIEALVRLGRGAEARARSLAFTRAFPGSPQQAQVRRLVEQAPP